LHLSQSFLQVTHFPKVDKKPGTDRVLLRLTSATLEPERKREARKQHEHNMRFEGEITMKRKKKQDKMFINLYRDITEALKQGEMSLYDRYIWSIAQDPTTFAERPELRLAFQACITMSSFTSPAIREAVAAIEDELAILDEDTANERIIEIVNHKIDEAEALAFALSEEDDQAITEARLAHQLHALRANILTEKEIEQAINDFNGLNYQEACPDVERLLTHSAPAIRRRALETLILSWGLSRYKKRAFPFLDDPDPECRIAAMRCLNPRGTVINDLRILMVYAHIAADQNEQPFVRCNAYGELLTATGYNLDYKHWMEIEHFLENGGTIEQAPWIDWNLVQFFAEENLEHCIFITTLSYQERWKEWTDQHGRAFLTIGEFTKEVLRRTHQLARTRIPHYQMTITVSWQKQDAPAEQTEMKQGYSDEKQKEESM
jgi:hypothetical protein